MNKAGFNQLVDDLLKRVEKLHVDDYFEATSIVKEFESLAHTHSKYLNQYTTEHVYAIQADFENAKKYKKRDLKYQHFNSGVSGLRQDIASMKRNTFPE